MAALLEVTDLHAGWALIGWVGLLVAAVAWQVVPMFSITAPYPRWLRTTLAPTVVTALGLASLDAGWPLSDWLRHAGALGRHAGLHALESSHDVSDVPLVREASARAQSLAQRHRLHRVTAAREPDPRVTYPA